MSDWQPIETAQKTGELILICAAKHGHFMVRAAYYDEDGNKEFPWFVEDSGKGFGHHKDWPTHWMPLPERPK